MTDSIPSPTDPSRTTPSRTTLADQLHRGAAGLRGEVPPDGLLAGVHRRLQAEGPAVWRRPPASWAGRLKWLAAAGSGGWRGPAWAAACAALLALVVLMPSDPMDPAADPQAGNAEQAWVRDARFVPVAGHEHWRSVAQAAPGQVWLVPAEMPRERLVALGLPYDPSRVGERVRAQLLVHASGDVLAVRVMQ
jgi:hypothetical protein